MGHSDVHPRAGRRVGGTHRPLSPGQSGSVVCSHRSSVCTCGGTRIPARGLAAGSGGFLGSTPGHSLQAPHKPARPALSHPRPLPVCLSPLDGGVQASLRLIQVHHRNCPLSLSVSRGMSLPCPGSVPLDVSGTNLHLNVPEALGTQ